MKLHAEEREAVDFVRLFRMRFPEVAARALIHHANERRKDRTGAGFAGYNLLMAMGFKPGLVDYQLAEARGGFNGLWAELKAPGGPLKDTQRQFLADMHAAGYACLVAWNGLAMLEATSWYVRGIRPELFAEGIVGFPAMRHGDPLEAVPLETLTLTGTPRRKSGGTK